jgi:molybdopterin-containing oxidoreductase family iron-sulfur binding subunit
VSSINHHVTGQQYWRSLEQLAGTGAVADSLDQEFASYDPDTIAGTSRRGFMKLMGAAMALAGLTSGGCRRWPKEELTPYSSNPRGITPGVAERYATSWELGGIAASLLVTSFDGRPIKIEGNPDHPASQTKVVDREGKAVDPKHRYGSADAFAQASLLEMYDPERNSDGLINRTGAQEHTTWEAFTAVARPTFAGLKDKKGAGFAILTEATSSPSVMAQRKALSEAFPQAKWYEYEALSRDNEREGAKLAFGKPLRTVLQLEEADVIVALDADFLYDHPNHTRYANDWAQNRRSADREEKKMNRVFVAESGLSLTGSVADVRISVAPAKIAVLARHLAAHFGVGTAPAEKLSGGESTFLESAAKDLKEAKGKGVVIVGPSAAPETHAIGHAINAALKSVGKAVDYVDVAESDPDRPTHMQAIAALASAMNSGAVTHLLILGGNPVYDAPADLKFAEALAKVPTSIHLSLYDDETSRASKWHLPRAHYLESWGDSMTWDGTVTLQQPLILPLFGGKSVIELLAILLSDEITAGEKIVRRTQGQPPLGAAKEHATEQEIAQRKKEVEAADTFEKNFRKALMAGFLVGSEFKPTPEPKVKPLTLSAPAAAHGEAYTLRFEADSRAYDGRFANNGWLQETPDPLSKLVWDNALLMSVKDAKKLDVDNGEMVEVTAGAAKLAVPICLLPGQPVGVVSLSLGYGRTAAGKVGDGLGFNANLLRTAKDPWTVAGVQIKKTGATYSLVTSAEHHLLSPMAQEGEQYRVGRKFETGKIVREYTLDTYKENPEDLGGMVRKVALQLFQEPVTEASGGKNFRDLHAWAMKIDLAVCIGCNACALACQAENNIPIVGKDQCYRHREMNWIRIDRYFKFEDKGNGPDIEDESPEIIFQPMTCQHCENAPCEQVCPVAATVHDTEGLNTMVYNRCIGTRYCSNNCPYKVRRFNYFDYHAEDPRMGNAWVKMPWLNLPDAQQRDPKLIDPIKRMVFNPDVTVRMRGVMEKCTYCVQRIHTTVIAKRTEGKGHDVVDGDIITACQQACPTQAIVFGNLNDPTSEVSQLDKNARVFDVLHDELNTRPRTRYLAKLRNSAEKA